MDMTQVLDLGRQTLIVTLIISAPVLLVGLVLGLLISIIQTVTQIQDQTISIVPKIIAMIAAAAFFIPWIAIRLVQFSKEMFTGF